MLGAVQEVVKAWLGPHIRDVHGVLSRGSPWESHGKHRGAARRPVDKADD